MNAPVEVKVETARPYSVWVGPSILERASELLPLEGPLEFGMIVGDVNALAHHGDRAVEGLARLCARLERESIAGAESAKTVARAEALLRRLAVAGAHRTDVVAALGGGAVGDLAGFAAAVYHRGMPFVQMPTTLLAQVDASIGGKTGVNLPEGKNLVGAFHQPVGVIADVTALESLPAAEFASGMAEVVKHGLIDDPAILDALSSDAALIEARDAGALTRLVASAAAVKARAVSRDETEQGTRAFLNYGHTLGHALEALGGYARWRHGEAVAIGMMFAAHLAVALGYEDLVDLHRRAVQGAGLPTKGAEPSYEEVVAAMQRDKKYQRGLRFVVLEELGRPRLVADVPDTALRAAYREVTS